MKCSCGVEYNLKTQSSNYVVHIHVKYQLEVFLEDEEIKTALLKGIWNAKERENDESGQIRNVYDVTLKFSTDGAPICHSGKWSFWPVQAILNELPLNHQLKYPLIYKKETSPQFMNAYMKHFINQLVPLAEKGLQITDENGKLLLLKVLPLCCPVDSVARPILQNRDQYNGYCG